MDHKKLLGMLPLLYCNDAYSAEGFAEGFVGSSATVLDTRFFGELGPYTGFFTRNITSVNYDGNVDPFTLVDLSYLLSKNIAIVAETQLSPDSGFVLRGGWQYAHSVEPFTASFLSTIGVQEAPTLEWAGLFSYTRPLGKSYTFGSRLEFAVNVAGGEVYNFSAERARVGLRKGDYSFGLAANLLQVGPELENSSNLGLFVGKAF